MNVFEQSKLGLPLTPEQRAFLKLVQGFLGTAGTTALYAAADYFMLNAGDINWQALAFVVGGQAVLAFVLAISKYLSAQQDSAPIGGALEKLAKAVADHLKIEYETRPQNAIVEKPQIKRSGNWLASSDDV